MNDSIPTPRTNAAVFNGFHYLKAESRKLERESAAQSAAIRSIVHDLTAIAERHSGTDIAAELAPLFMRANAILASGKEPSHE